MVSRSPVVLLVTSAPAWPWRSGLPPTVRLEEVRRQVPKAIDAKPGAVGNTRGVAVPMGCCYHPVTILRVDFSLTFVKVRHMPVVTMVKPDVKKIFQLIKEWDQRARRGTMPPPRPQPSAITRFAASLHEPPRHRQSFWNMRAGKLISEDFAAQI